MSSPISGFTAIPNPQMLAFMPIQSYLMMYFAGSGWQYGKRRISAMSNEQFNKLTPEELLMQHSIELKNMLPTLTKTLNDVTPLVKELIIQYGDFVKEAIKVLPEVVQNISFGNQGTLQGTDLKTSIVPSWWQGSALSYAKYQLQQAIDNQKLKEQFTSGLPSSSGKDIYQGYGTFEELHAAKGHLGHQHKEDLKKAFGKPIIPQIAKINLKGKKKAGQSQILERNKLIKFISEKGKQIKLFNKASMKLSDFNFEVKQLKNAQQKLVNLLANYKF